MRIMDLFANPSQGQPRQLSHNPYLDLRYRFLQLCQPIQIFSILSFHNKMTIKPKTTSLTILPSFLRKSQKVLISSFPSNTPLLIIKAISSYKKFIVLRHTS